MRHRERRRRAPPPRGIVQGPCRPRGIDIPAAPSSPKNCDVHGSPYCISGRAPRAPGRMRAWGGRFARGSGAAGRVRPISHKRRGPGKCQKGRSRGGPAILPRPGERAAAGPIHGALAVRGDGRAESRKGASSAGRPRSGCPGTQGGSRGSRKGASSAGRPRRRGAVVPAPSPCRCASLDTEGGR